MLTREFNAILLSCVSVHGTIYTAAEANRTSMCPDATLSRSLLSYIIEIVFSILGTKTMFPFNDHIDHIVKSFAICKQLLCRCRDSFSGNEPQKPSYCIHAIDVLVVMRHTYLFGLENQVHTELWCKPDEW
jgi:hypothetical protein